MTELRSAHGRREADQAPDGGVDGPGLVRRVRREADLSQRELARVLGVSPSTVGRIESGAQPLSLRLFERVLALVGWSLSDALEGRRQRRVVPMREAVRDNGGRRYPAHLDVHPACVSPHWWMHANRRDRARPRADFEHRRRRDAVRRWFGSPPDHPTEYECWVHARRRTQHALKRRRQAVRPRAA